MRNFGLTSGATVGGNDQSRRPHGSKHYALPSQSLSSADLPFPRSNFLQAVLDILALLGAFLFVSATGCGIAFAVFCLLFVNL